MVGVIESSSLDPLRLIGKEINNITIVELLGCGAMGAVFVGYQKTLKRKVAVKFFPKRSSQESNYLIRFREEAEIVAGLNHPNIVQVFDMGETNDYLYIIMQLIVGEDLRTMIHRYQLHPVPARRLIEVKKVLEIILPILDALSYAHEEGVIHQDIKPGNILIEKRSSRSYLADFGIARSALNNEDDSSIIMGTPLYIAPEQVQEEEIDHRCDVYSAGVVLYEAIAGKLPVQKSTVEGLLNIKINSPETLFTDTPSNFCSLIDKDLEKIILKAIEPDKEKRFQDCHRFYEELSNYYYQRYNME